jgi:hypothetical protein
MNPMDPPLPLSRMLSRCPHDCAGAQTTLNSTGLHCLSISKAKSMVVKAYLQNSLKLKYY